MDDRAALLPWVVKGLAGISGRTSTA